MSDVEKQILALKEAVLDQNLHNQMLITSQISFWIDQSKNRAEVIHKFLSNNLANAISDVICTQLIILQPAMKLVHQLMEDATFRSYHFLPILKNILRVLILFVRTEEMENSQLEFFDLIDIFDELMKKFLTDDLPRKHDCDMQPTFLCLMKFIELVLSLDHVDLGIKNLMVEIYLHLLNLNRMFKCISNKFELIMKVANIGDEFLDRFVLEYKKDGSELWLYKILQILLKTFESLILNAGKSNNLELKVFENTFNRYMNFVLEQLRMPDSTAHNPGLFKLIISILNTILWTPDFSPKFRSKILKLFVRVNGDSYVFCLSKSSKKIRKLTTCTMKIFLTAMVTYSGNSQLNRHKILNTFLECNLFNSITELKAHEVHINYQTLILLWSCPILRQKLSSPLDAHNVLENSVIILNHYTTHLNGDELWRLLTIFSYYLNYAVLSELEFAGFQKISETLFQQICSPKFDMQEIQYPIDKYTIPFAKEFSTHTTIFNSLVFMYLSQQPDLTSSKVSHIVPTHSILPLLVSNDPNQVKNAVKILQKKQLTREDMHFVIEQCFSSSKTEEVNIGAALNLIGQHYSLISHEVRLKVYSETIEFLKAKQYTFKLSKECYLCIVKTCVSLIRFETKIETVQSSF